MISAGPLQCCVRTEMAVVVLECVLGVYQCDTGHTGTHCETSYPGSQTLPMEDCQRVGNHR